MKSTVKPIKGKSGAAETSRVESSQVKLNTVNKVKTSQAETSQVKSG